MYIYGLYYISLYPISCVAGNLFRFMRDFEPFAFGTNAADILELCIDKEMSKYASHGGIAVPDAEEAKRIISHMREYAQKAQSIVLREGRVLCEKLDKINRSFPSDDHRQDAEPLMKLPEKPVLDSNVTIEGLQEQISYQLKLNANYKEALLSLESELQTINADEIVIESKTELI